MPVPLADNFQAVSLFQQCLGCPKPPCPRLPFLGEALSTLQKRRGSQGLRVLPSESLCSLVPTEEPIRLLREVVLLTDDRNLRVKALTRNVPVRDIPAFLTWAQVG